MSRRALLHKQINKSLPSRVSRLLSASGRGGGCWQAVGAEVTAMRSESVRAAERGSVTDQREAGRGRACTGESLLGEQAVSGWGAGRNPKARG